MYPVKVFPIAILAGGRSQRMGTDKALLDFRGRPLVDYAIETATSIEPRVTVVVHPDQLPIPGYQRMARRPEVTVIPDQFDHSGPIGGLVTALRFHRDHRGVVLLPCDMPFLTPELIASLTASHLDSENDATVVEDENGQAQPLVGVYSGSVLRVAAEMIGSGRLRFGSLLERLRLGRIPAGGERSTLLNINHPVDLDTADLGYRRS